MVLVLQELFLIIWPQQTKATPTCCCRFHAATCGVGVGVAISIHQMFPFRIFFFLLYFFILCWHVGSHLTANACSSYKQPGQQKRDIIPQLRAVNDLSNGDGCFQPNVAGELRYWGSPFTSWRHLHRTFSSCARDEGGKMRVLQALQKGGLRLVTLCWCSLFGTVSL